MNEHHTGRGRSKGVKANVLRGFVVTVIVADATRLCLQTRDDMDRVSISTVTVCPPCRPTWESRGRITGGHERKSAEHTSPRVGSHTFETLASYGC